MPLNPDQWVALRDQLADGACGDVQLERDYLDAVYECFRLFQQRQKKYGPGNIARTSDTGVAVRVSDKSERLLQYYVRNEGRGASDESIDDTWMDTHVYGTIGLLCRRGLWPGAARPATSRGWIDDYRAKAALDTLATVPAMRTPEQELLKPPAVSGLAERIMAPVAVGGPKPVVQTGWRGGGCE